jgi:hypothetical protein
LLDLRREQFNLRMQKGTGQLTQTHQLRKAVRREIARDQDPVLEANQVGRCRHERYEQRMALHTVEGRVVSNKMDKTVTVLMSSVRSSMPCTASIVKRSTKLHAHDEEGKCLQRRRRGARR